MLLWMWEKASTEATQSQSQALSQPLICLAAEALLCVLPCTRANVIPKPSAFHGSLSVVFFLLPFSLQPYHKGQDAHLQALRHIHTRTRMCTHTKRYTHTKLHTWQRQKKTHMPQSADNYSHPHINTHAEKTEMHKRMGFMFIQVLKWWIIRVHKILKVQWVGKIYVSNCWCSP